MKLLKGNIKGKLSQIKTFDCTFVDDIGDCETYLTVGTVFRGFVDDQRYITGIVKRVERDRMTNFYRILGEDVGCIIRDLVVETPVIYDTPTYTRTIIEKSFLPDGWAFDWAGTDPGHMVSYTANSGSWLSHITNLCALNNWDWEADEYYTEYESGTTWSKYVLRCKTIGSQTVTNTFANNSEIIRLKSYEDQSKQITSAQIPGIDSVAADYDSSLSMYTATYSPLYTQENRLNDNITATQTNLPMYVDGWVETSYTAPGTVLIDSEKIKYTNVAATGIWGCTRGTLSTSSAAHGINSPVLRVDRLTLTSSASFPDSGDIWIGMEKITYTSKSGNAIIDLARGVGSTPKYNHGNGTWVRDARMSATAPAIDSLVGIYGQREKRIDVGGFNTRDSLDKRAQSAIIKWGQPATRIEGTLPALSWSTTAKPPLGDYMCVTFASYGAGTMMVGTVATTFWVQPDPISQRLTGYNWTWPKLMEVEMGYVEDHLVDDIAKIYNVADVSVEKQNNMRPASIAVLTADSKFAYVTFADGSQGWVEIR